jgi:uncharacterized membrane protein
MSEAAPAIGSGGLRLATSRLQALADGIFSIAMTLLIFEIHLPLVRPTAAELPHALIELWPRFASFALSFVTLGFSWIGHHNQYAAIQRVDRTFLWINIVFFLFIVLVPFSSALLGEYPGEQLTVVLYAGNLVAAGALLLIHWTYATTRARLVDPGIHADLVASTKRRVGIAPAAYSLAIALSFLDVRLSWAVCIAVPLYFMLPGRVDKHWAAEAAKKA